MGKVKIKAMRTRRHFYLYQFPMGKVKQYYAADVNFDDSYQFPMGKVK